MDLWISYGVCLIYVVLLIRVVCLMMGFVEDLLHLEQMLLGHVRGRCVGCDEHSFLLDISHLFVGLK